MIPTPHINCTKNEIAKTVIMPGDPLRSKMIAETLLENAKLVNNVRGIQGYTGTYKGKLVTVMASGMGNPSMGIYSYELFKEYDVDNIIRVGTIGAMKPEIKTKEIIIAQSVYSNSNYNNLCINNNSNYYTLNASDTLASKAEKIANQIKIKYNIGTILNSDTFYTDVNEKELALKNNLLGVEMESVALYENARRLNKNALCICTVSNNIITGEETSSEDRQNAFVDMIKLALELI